MENRLLKEAKKTKSKEKKAKQRSRKVLCKCRLCEGTSELAIRTARKHLKLYGRFESKLNNGGNSTGYTLEGESSFESDESTDQLDGLEFMEDDSDAYTDNSECTLREEGECAVETDQSFVTSNLHMNPMNNEDQEENIIDVYETDLYDTERAKIPLYTTSDKTVLQTLCHYFCWFSEHPGVSKSSLSDLLSLQHRYVLPPNNNLPSSYDDAFKFIEPFLLPLDTYHVCPNHCVVFRNGPRFNYKNLSKCPECGSLRYFSNKQPRNCFHYYPVGPRWRRMYGDATIAEVLQSHRMPENSRKCDVMTDFQDSPQFLEAFSSNGILGEDPRGLALQFSTDGMNPFSHGNYSMWPLTLTMFNLPKKVRHLFSSLMLVGIVPGQRDSDCTLKIDAYLEVLVDELCELSGVTFYDGFNKETFSFKVAILNHVLDYPGLNKLFCAFGANAIQACMWCDLEGTYIDSLDKTVYLGNRRYLPTDSSLRLDKEHFPDKAVDKREPPCKRNFTDIMIDSIAYENAPNATQARNIARGSGVKSCYSLMMLPGHNRTTQAFPDIMHASKNVVLAIFDLITGREDTDKVRKTEVALERFNAQSINNIDDANQTDIISKG